MAARRCCCEWKKRLCACCRAASPPPTDPAAPTSTTTATPPPHSPPPTDPAAPTSTSTATPPTSCFKPVETTIENLSKLLITLEEMCDHLKQEKQTAGGLPSQWEEFATNGKDFMKAVEAAAGTDIILPLTKKVLGELGNLHWMTVGCSLIAWALKSINLNAQNWEACVKLLGRVIGLLKLCKDLMVANGGNSEVCRMIQETVEVACICAAGPVSFTGRTSLSRFFGAQTITESIEKLEKELERTSAALGRFVVVQTYLDGLPSRPLYSAPKADDIVGGSDVMQKVMERLSTDSKEAVAVCLHGMGGIGKSTMAMSILVEFQKRGYQCCRVELPFEIQPEQDLPKAQSRMLEMACLLKREISNTTDGRAYMEQSLSESNSPLFLYVDNVREGAHLSEMLPKACYFPPVSKILITTRNEGVFDGVLDLEFNTHELIEVKKLTMADAKVLLWKNVRAKDVDAKILVDEGLEEELLRLCDGLPLALTLVGRYIGRNKQGPSNGEEVWTRVIKAMKGAQPLYGEAMDALHSRLKFSVNFLDEEWRRAFLDIVVFGVGQPLEEAKCLVKRGDYLQDLQERGLVEFKMKEEFGQPEGVTLGMLVDVHDVLRAIGLRMVAEDDKEKRLTSQDELDRTQSSGELWKVVGIMHAKMEARIFQHMPSLRILSNVTVKGECPVTKLPHLLYVWMRRVTCKSFDVSGCTSLQALWWWVNVDDVEVLSFFPSIHTSDIKMCEQISSPIVQDNLTLVSRVQLEMANDC